MTRNKYCYVRIVHIDTGEIIRELGRFDCHSHAAMFWNQVTNKYKSMILEDKIIITLTDKTGITYRANKYYSFAEEYSI